jgi:hypothetical protein
MSFATPIPTCMNFAIFLLAGVAAHCIMVGSNQFVDVSD